MPSVFVLFKVVCTTRDDMLKSFRFTVEGACRLLRNWLFVQILPGWKGVVQIFDKEVKDIFRHVLLDSGPEAAGSRTCMCKNGRDNEYLRL